MSSEYMGLQLCLSIIELGLYNGWFFIQLATYRLGDAGWSHIWLWQALSNR
ncbi:hypothetical protein [Psychrobacter halodurans]|uniref:Uncharacterized protein n=1 Tax=Psychrobacter halodurans TaxID=2818439 RepID=A0AAW4IQ27_9GAMM|nr:hypothetical protein [Psychrobacter halodurans]MBO1517434.1 hypothetical protein [Psychrobacter halodurans]